MEKQENITRESFTTHSVRATNTVRVRALTVTPTPRARQSQFLKHSLWVAQTSFITKTLPYKDASASFRSAGRPGFDSNLGLIFLAAVVSSMIPGFTQNPLQRVLRNLSLGIKRSERESKVSSIQCRDKECVELYLQYQNVILLTVRWLSKDNTIYPMKVIVTRGFFKLLTQQ
jgi:hypothetical protein